MLHLTGLRKGGGAQHISKSGNAIVQHLSENVKRRDFVSMHFAAGKEALQGKVK